MRFPDLWRRIRGNAHTRTPLFFHNTLSGKNEVFEKMPHAREVRMYNCGPTVYGRQHIGNLSMFVFSDVLRRTLEYNGLNVKQAINITDFGHLSSDQDEGDDKMSVGLKREGLKLTLENMKVLGEKYTNLFLEDIRALNVEVDRVLFPRASEYVPAQITMIRTLEEKGYTYTTPRGVYFDTSRFPEYGKLGNINLEGLRAGARVETGDKRNPTDFILWKSDAKLGWDSPWGMGFPGWHIECSAMVRSVLGTQIDIHTGGIEHIPVHHNNEIAQSESATGKKPFSRFWLHRAHLQLEGTKIAKSEGNVVYLSDITERGFHPLALRYLLLGAHYRTSSNFTWEALGASQTAFAKLLALRLSIEGPVGEVPKRWQARFSERVNDDLDTPGALAVLWEMTKDSSLSPVDLLAGLLEFDKVLGLNLTEPDENAKEKSSNVIKKMLTYEVIPARVKELIDERETARKSKDWARADQVRDEIAAEGYGIEDTDTGARVYKL
jgi:cysteinyl-tRNA synthetase